MFIKLNVLLEDTTNERLGIKGNTEFTECILNTDQIEFILNTPDNEEGRTMVGMKSGQSFLTDLSLSEFTKKTNINYLI